MDSGISLNWPGVGLVLGIFFLLLFRKPIIHLIGRIKKIGRWDIESPPSQAQRSPEDKGPVDELMRGFDSALLIEHEAAIQRDLSQRDIPNDADKIKILIRHLAATQISRYFESLYRNIWGGQIQILQFINSTGGLAFKQDLKPFFEASVNNFPVTLTGYTLESFLKYLIDEHLIIEREGEVYEITIRGKGFLLYMVEVGLPQKTI